MNSISRKLIFTQKMNPTTGKIEWIAECQDEHDYFTDVARSSYADMLHDTERNTLYYKAIKQAVKQIHSRGQQARVLDIGTGTGLLSMMATKAGAEVVTAVEVFKPMANIAKIVTKQNGCQLINVVNKHSTEVSVGPGEDMEERANILVTELFDTELIGEGALASYHHAHLHLLEEDCIAVPKRAIVYATIVESDIMASWNELRKISVSYNGKRIEIDPNPEMSQCPGNQAVHDIQLSQFPADKLKEITEPSAVFIFDWWKRSISEESVCNILNVEANCDGLGQVVLSWWDLEMNDDGSLLLSTAPKWHHPNPNQMQWRDHWLQSIYFLPHPFKCGKGDILTLKACHDAYSIWFDVAINRMMEKSLERPVCMYLPRMLLGRPRLSRMNDLSINQIYCNVFHEMTVPELGVAVCISDFSLLPILAKLTKFKNRNVVVVERSQVAQRGLFNLLQNNNLQLDLVCGDIASLPGVLHGREIALVFGEPYFSTSLLPWHDLYFWYARSEMNSYLHPNFKVMPHQGHLCIAAVYFRDLWKIRAPVGTVEGFDLSSMDRMIEDALDKKEYHEAEPHALWEYPNRLLMKPIRIMTFDFTKMIPETQLSSHGLLSLSQNNNAIFCHGVVLWMEYDLDGTRTVSNGLIPPSSAGDFHATCLSNPNWCMHCKQAVFLFKTPHDITLSQCSLNYDVIFLPHTGEVNMKFSIQ